MRKLLVIILAFALCISLAACGGGSTEPEPAATPEPAPATTPDPEPADEPAVAPDPEDDAAAATDYLSVAEPLVAAGGPGTVIHEQRGVTMRVTIPDGWTARSDYAGEVLYLYDIPPKEEGKEYGGNAHISIGVKTHDMLAIPNDAIYLPDLIVGGITMRGVLYEFGGEEYVDYGGEASNGDWVRIYSKGIDFESGDGKAVWDSIEFTAN